MQQNVIFILAATIKKYISLLLNLSLKLLTLLLSCLYQLTLFFGRWTIDVQRIVDKDKSIVVESAPRGKSIFYCFRIRRRENGIYSYSYDIFDHFWDYFAQNIAVNFKTGIRVSLYEIGI